MRNRGAFVGWLSTLARKFITLVAAFVLLNSFSPRVFSAIVPCSSSSPVCDGICVSVGPVIPCVPVPDGAMREGSGGGIVCMCATLTPTATVTNTPTATPTNTPADDGAPCTDPMDCISRNCVDDVCCDTECNEPDQICNLAGSVGTCTDLAAPAPTTSRTALLIGLGILAAIAAVALWRRRELRHYLWSV